MLVKKVKKVIAKVFIVRAFSAISKRRTLTGCPENTIMPLPATQLLHAVDGVDGVMWILDTVAQGSIVPGTELVYTKLNA